MQKITLWCSNDYLGMSANKELLSILQSELYNFGIGSGGTRNIGGNTHSIMSLENLLANQHKKEAGLVFTSGYVANEGTISALGKIIPNLVIFSDQYNHASIIAGISNSRMRKFIYRHLDMVDLEQSLQKVPIDQPKIIIFESIYSMNGLMSPVDKIVELAKRYNALTYIDEVHSVGLYGDKGSGVCNMLGLDGRVDIIQGNLAKAYGVLGGYIVSDKAVIESIRLTSHEFIFTTSIPPLITMAAQKSIEIVQRSENLRTEFHKKVNLLKQLLQNSDIYFINNNTHIISIILGSPFLAKNVSDILLKKYSIFVQHINFPTVPKGTERLRITLTPYHSEGMIFDLIEAISHSLKEINLDQKMFYKMNNYCDYVEDAS